MKRLKCIILFVILFMTIGIAVVSSNLLINGSTPIASNPGDFNVYFSDVLVNGTQDLSLVTSETSLVFTGEFSAVGDKKTITYDVTNASKNYDADIDITCTQSTEYLTITNDFDVESNLSARSTRSGVLTITLSKSYTGTDLTQDISCTISASAVERTSQGSGSVVAPLNPYYIGREISFGEEKFNIISDNGDTVTMLAQFNIDSVSYKQSSTQANTSFANSNGWDYKVIKTHTEWFVKATNPSDIDIQVWGGDSKNVLNKYILNLQTILGDNTITGDIISFKELRALGCEDLDSEYMDGMSLTPSCANSPYLDILANGQYWWTRTPLPDDPETIYFMYDKSLAATLYTTSIGVRPIVTVKKETLSQEYFAFSIDGRTFFAIKGMTWEEWIDSSFNDGTFHTSTYLMQKGIYIKINGNLILPSEKIVENGTYILEY